QSPLSSDLAKHLQHQKQNTAMVLIAYPSVGVRDERTRSALDVLDALLTGGGAAGGRLHEELRGEQLVYYVFGMQVSGFVPGYFAFLAHDPPRRGDTVRRTDARRPRKDPPRGNSRRRVREGQGQTDCLARHEEHDARRAGLSGVDRRTVRAGIRLRQVVSRPD